MTVAARRPDFSALLDRALLRRRLVAAAIAGLIGLGLAAEFRSLARPDTGFLLDAAGRVLDGQRLYRDVVEINPPLIIALNLPPVLLARALGASDIAVYRALVAAAILALMMVAYPLLRRLLPDAPATRHGLAIAAAFVLFLLVGQDYGEREHLVLALLLPWLWLAALRVKGEAVDRRSAIAIGLLAGVALSLKPHFLLVWLGTEAWIAVGGRDRRWSVRPETLALATWLALYGLGVVLFAPAYFDLVALLAGPYSRFVYDSFFHLLVSGPGALLTGFALLVYGVLCRQARHRALWHAMAIGAAGCFLAGAVQQKGLRYHFYPSFALGALVLALAVLDAAPVPGLARRLYRWAAAGTLAVTVVLVGAQNAAMALGRAPDAERAQLERLIALVHDRARGKPVYVFSYHIGSVYPLINYSGARSASRFPHLWILAAEYRDELMRPAALVYRPPAAMSPSERFLGRAVREDLERNRPNLLIVYRAARDRPQNGYRRLDYVAYFNRDPVVARIFTKYQRIARTSDYDVFERVPEGVARTGPAMTVEAPTQDIVPVRGKVIGVGRAD